MFWCVSMMGVVILCAFMCICSWVVRLGLLWLMLYVCFIRVVYRIVVIGWLIMKYG